MRKPLIFCVALLLCAAPAYAARGNALEEEMDWIYYGKKSPLRTKAGDTFAVIAPKAYNGIRIVGLSNGQIISLPDDKIEPHLKK